MFVDCKIDGQKAIDLALLDNSSDNQVLSLQAQKTLTKNVMEDILNVTSKADPKTRTNKHKYQEPLLYANEYFFKDEENL